MAERFRAHARLFGGGPPRGLCDTKVSYCVTHGRAGGEAVVPVSLLSHRRAEKSARSYVRLSGRLPVVREKGHVEGFGYLLRQLFHLPQRADRTHRAVVAAEHPMVASAAGPGSSVAGSRIAGRGGPLSHSGACRGHNRGAGGLGSVVGTLPDEAGVQVGSVRAQCGCGGPVRSVRQDRFGRWPDQRFDAVARPEPGAPTRCISRPGRRCCEEYSGRWAGGPGLRRWCETTPQLMWGGNCR